MSMKKTLFFVFALLLFTAQASAADYQRIVSLSPVLTSQIYDLGAQKLLVGITKYAMNPGGTKEVVGNLTDLNLEKIALLKPDLIIAGKDANRKKDIEKLKSMGFRIEVFEGCESFECMCAEFSKLGKLIGQSRQAEKIITECKSQVAAIKVQSIKKDCRVMWQVGENPLIVSGGKTFANEFITISGCVNVFGGLKAKYPRISMEDVLIKNPEVIIMISGMGAGVSTWKTRPGIKAVKKNKVYVIDADKVCQATPRKYVEGLKLVSSVLSGSAR
jgi:iron complex transport system substrate-binding protein